MNRNITQNEKYQSQKYQQNAMYLLLGVSGSMLPQDVKSTVGSY
jgi:hypothetical protein